MTPIPYQPQDGSPATITVDLADMRPGGLTPFLAGWDAKAQWGRMLADYLFRGPSGAIHKLPSGYGWNGASIPAGVQWLTEEPEEHLEQSGPHDLGYQFGAYETWQPNAGLWAWCAASKSYVDSVFFSQGLHATDESHLLDSTMWRALRAFGWFAWWFGNCPHRCDVCKPPSSRDCCYKGVKYPTFPTTIGAPLK